jgi:hypothetical protein
VGGRAGIFIVLVKKISEPFSVWNIVYLFHMIGKNIFAFLLTRKKYFD